MWAKTPLGNALYYISNFSRYTLARIDLETKPISIKINLPNNNREINSFSGDIKDCKKYIEEILKKEYGVAGSVAT